MLGTYYRYPVLSVKASVAPSPFFEFPHLPPLLATMERRCRRRCLAALRRQARVKPRSKWDASGPFVAASLRIRRFPLLPAPVPSNAGRPPCSLPNTRNSALRKKAPRRIKLDHPEEPQVKPNAQIVLRIFLIRLA